MTYANVYLLTEEENEIHIGSNWNIINIINPFLPKTLRLNSVHPSSCFISKFCKATSMLSKSARPSLRPGPNLNFLVIGIVHYASLDSSGTIITGHMLNRECQRWCTIQQQLEYGNEFVCQLSSHISLITTSSLSLFLFLTTTVINHSRRRSSR